MNKQRQNSKTEHILVNLLTDHLSSINKQLQDDRDYTEEAVKWVRAISRFDIGRREIMNAGVHRTLAEIAMRPEASEVAKTEALATLVELVTNENDNLYDEISRLDMFSKFVVAVRAALLVGVERQNEIMRPKRAAKCCSKRLPRITRPAIWGLMNSKPRRDRLPGSQRMWAQWMKLLGVLVSGDVLDHAVRQGRDFFEALKPAFFYKTESIQVLKTILKKLIGLVNARPFRALLIESRFIPQIQRRLQSDGATDLAYQYLFFVLVRDILRHTPVKLPGEREDILCNFSGVIGAVRTTKQETKFPCVAMLCSEVVTEWNRVIPYVGGC